jgi:hypothetical protein
MRLISRRQESSFEGMYATQAKCIIMLKLFNFDYMGIELSMLLESLQSHQSLACAFHICDLKISVKYKSPSWKEIGTNLLWCIHCKDGSVLFADENFVLFIKPDQHGE